MKRLFKALVIFFLLLVLLGAGGFFYLSRGLEAGEKVIINGIDVSTLPDGDYEGEFEHGRWTNKVRVTVKEQKITAIELIDDVMIAQPGLADEIIAKVLQTQNTKVDAVSGATVTSKAYLKAIENAVKDHDALK